MDLGLKGAKALVTGGSRGLGYATALKLSEEGCQVAINGRDADSLAMAAINIKASSGENVFQFSGDLGNADVPSKIVDQAAKQLGGLDLLVTNTGGPPPGKFDDFNDADWASAIDLVFYAHLRLI